MQKSHAARRAKVGALAIFLSGTTACFNTSPGATPDAGSFDAGIHEAGTSGSDSGSDSATMDVAADATTVDASTAECTVASDCDDSDKCTVDACESSRCTHIAAVLDDHLACTVDACTPQSGVTHTPGIYFTETFADNTKGWTLGTTWEIGAEIASPTDPPPGPLSHPDPTSDHSPSSDNGVAGVSIGGNVGSAPNAHFFLTSPTIDLGGVTGPVLLEFWRYLNSDAPPFMISTVEVFDGAWHIVYQNIGVVTDSAWTKVQYDVTAYKSASFKMRWGYQVGSQGAAVCSQWNVDDVRLVAAADCP